MTQMPNDSRQARTEPAGSHGIRPAPPSAVWLSAASDFGVIEPYPHDYGGGGNMSFATSRPAALAPQGIGSASRSAAIHELFSEARGVSSGAYAATEAANAAATG